MLFVGDDWAEDHHDVEIVDDTGGVLARRRLSNGLDGITVLHAMIGEHLPEGWADWEPAQVAGLVKVGIETDRGPWVAALVATGYDFADSPYFGYRRGSRFAKEGCRWAHDPARGLFRGTGSGRALRDRRQRPGELSQRLGRPEPGGRARDPLRAGPARADRLLHSPAATPAGRRAGGRDLGSRQD